MMNRYSLFAIGSTPLPIEFKINNVNITFCLYCLDNVIGIIIKIIGTMELVGMELL